ncbi:MAG TPA: L,D-transpeptidase family protein [Chloroflexota bacterium]|nr:L,D-transpeptidase family protein [Chloroflexota bacterium]
MSPHRPSFSRRLIGPAVSLLLLGSVVLGPGGVLAEPGGDQSQPVAVVGPGQTPASATWAVNLNPVTLYSGPSADAESFGSLPALTTLQVLGYDGDWAHVFDPRTRTEAYLQSDQLGPGEPPSRYLLLPPPALTDEFAIDTRGILTDGAPLALYPTAADEASEKQLNPNTWLTLTGAVNGEDGSRWYRTDTGDFVPADVVFVPQRSEDFGGHWLDVDLNSPARVTAYEGDTQVATFLAIKGTGTRPTPTGVFTILRRVANETMNSDTIGIPRFGPGGYYLTNVLFTQYFTGDGASFHYNYWSSMWGYAGSHGCLGLTYGDSAWLWEWAHVGTPVTIHY